ncbi:MAG: class II fumarate hydratase [Ruminococcaceae bacterium]|nr:class II fumarate hydratase [Oscillospiraceae bacterium]
MAYRTEHDSMGDVLVPGDRLWGAQTQRSLENFPIGEEKMPREIIRAFGYLKKAAARANAALRPDKMTAQKCAIIGKACDEIIEGCLDGHFPLVVWQTGSGTQSNMNVNEVIANRGNQSLGAPLLHPNDDVNMSQSSNDTFPTAMHIAAILSVEQTLLPAAEDLCATLRRLEEENADVIKCGRTHLQDATPIRFSQEISGWRASIEKNITMICDALEHLRPLALGGTAVGTGLNAPCGFDTAVAKEISDLCGTPFTTADNKFHALSSKGELVTAHGTLKALAADLMKIANDVRWLASGPRLGLGEITIPENEPGSSIMPGKVNPTQCEAITMIALQVMGNDATIGMAASQGNFELNVFMPVIAYNFLQSVRLLSDGMRSFNDRCVSGIKANRDKMSDNLNRSLMLVTCLNPHIGYENAARVAKKAYAEGISLKDACIALGYLDAEQFDKVFRPEEMV